MLSLDHIHDMVCKTLKELQAIDSKTMICWCCLVIKGLDAPEESKIVDIRIRRLSKLDIA
jgi:hypothetical protein